MKLLEKYSTDPSSDLAHHDAEQNKTLAIQNACTQKSYADLTDLMKTGFSPKQILLMPGSGLNPLIISTIFPETRVTTTSKQAEEKTFHGQNLVQHFEMKKYAQP